MARFTSRFAVASGRFLRWGGGQASQPASQHGGYLSEATFASISIIAEDPHLQQRTFRNLATAAPGKIKGSIPYGVISDDLFSARVLYQRGAFSDSITTGDARCCWNEPATLLGRQSSGSLHVWDDRAAVHFECDPGGTSYSNDLVKLIQRGDITDLSLYYFVLRSHKEQDSLGSYQVVESGSLIAIAVMSFGAFDGAIADVASAIASARAEGKIAGYLEASKNIKRQSKRESAALWNRGRSITNSDSDLDKLSLEISRLQRK
jgi:HK97 family phage prohead protease